MKRMVFAVAVATAALGFSTSSQAGVYTDDLSRCLVRSSTAEDQTALIAWIFAAISAHPDLQRYSTMTDSQKAAISAKAGSLLERLLTVDCRKEAVAGLKYEGGVAFETSFGVLGQIAMRGIMSQPDVSASIGDLTKGMDRAKIEALGREAGTLAPSL